MQTPRLRQLMWVTAAAAALSTVFTAAQGALGGRREHSVLESVSGLDRQVTFAESKIALGDLVRRVAKETGAALDSAKDVADEPVAVAVEGYPARKLLEQLAELLDYQWRTTGVAANRRYEIWQDLASKNREEALRQAFGGDIERRFQEAVRQVVAMAALSQSEIDALVAQSDERERQLRELPDAQRIALVTKPEGRALLERGAYAAQLWYPVNRGLARLVGSLTPEQSEKLREGDPVAFSTRPEAGEFTLPVDLLRTLQESPFQIRRRGEPKTREGVDEAVSRRNQKSEELWTRAAGFKIMAWLDAEQPQEALRLYVNAYPLEGNSPAQEFWGGEMGRLRIEVGSWATKQQLHADERTDERAEAMRSDPVLGVRKQLAVPPARKTQRRLIHDYLPYVARAYRVPIISDAYNGSMQPRPPAETESVALFERIDRFTGVHHRWDYLDGVLRVRNRTWFLRRRSEVPLRVFQGWQETCKQYGALRWEDLRDRYGRRAGAGEDEDKSEMGLPSDFGGIRARHALPLYEALTPEQRRKLELGQPLSMAQMSRAQQALFLGALRQGDRYHISVGLPPQPTPDPAVANFTIRSERLVRTRDLHGGVTRYRDQPASTTGQVPPLGEVDGKSARRFLVTRYKFGFRYTRDRTLTETLTVATPPRKAGSVKAE